MYTTKKVAELAGIGRSTVPHYAREWSDYLSDSAKPPKGQTRYYDDDDIAVFRTVKVLRDQGMTNDQIIEYLESGDRAEPPETPGDETTTAEDKPPGDSALISEREIKLSTEYARLQGEFDTIKLERDYLRQQVGELSQGRLDAEIRATAAETELKVLRDIVDREKPTEEPVTEERRSFWRRLFGG